MRALPALVLSQRGEVERLWWNADGAILIGTRQPVRVPMRGGGPVNGLLVVVAGPTAAGKTALGAALAERLGGEVVSADAFAVYRGMDIGTAKPPAELRRRIPHHLIDIADPRERLLGGSVRA